MGAQRSGEVINSRYVGRRLGGDQDVGRNVGRSLGGGRGRRLVARLLLVAWLGFLVHRALVNVHRLMVRVASSLLVGLGSSETRGRLLVHQT